VWSKNKNKGENKLKNKKKQKTTNEKTPAPRGKAFPLLLPLLSSCRKGEALHRRWAAVVPSPSIATPAIN
jgi:hypothetical protein